MKNHTPDLIPYRRVDKWGFCTQDKRIVIDCIYDYTCLFSEGCAKVWLGGKCGFIDKSNREVIPCTYDEAGDFSEGLVKVRLNGRWGFINKKGEIVAKCIYDDAEDFKEGLAKVALLHEPTDEIDMSEDEDDYEGENEKSNNRLYSDHYYYKYGFVNKMGELVISCKYEFANSFSDGLATISLKKVHDSHFADGYKYIDYGYIDKLGNIAIACIYDCVCDFKNGLAKVAEKKCSRDWGYYWGVIDKTGKQIIPCICYHENIFIYDEGLIRVHSEISDKYGLFEHNGNTLLPWNYEMIQDFSEGLAAVKLHDKYGFIDKSGKMVIPSVYEDAYVFSEGLAAVEINGKWGFIDKVGKLVIPCNFYGCALKFSEGLAKVLLKEKGKWGFIDKIGKQIVPFIYAEANDFSEGLAAVKIKNIFDEQQTAFIDKTGNVIILFNEGCHSSYVNNFTNSAAHISFTGFEHSWNIEGYLNKCGNKIMPYVFELNEDFPEAFIREVTIWGVIRKVTIEENTGVIIEREKGYIGYDGTEYWDGINMDSSSFDRIVSASWWLEQQNVMENNAHLI